MKYTCEERLEFYRNGLEHWLEGRFGSARNYTNIGFCRYYFYMHKLEVWREKDFKRLLPELFEQKNGNFGTHGAYHYPVGGTKDEGREFRRVALKNAISKVKLKIKNTIIR